MRFYTSARAVAQSGYRIYRFTSLRQTRRLFQGARRPKTSARPAIVAIPEEKLKPGVWLDGMKQASPAKGN